MSLMKGTMKAKGEDPLGGGGGGGGGGSAPGPAVVLEDYGAADHTSMVEEEESSSSTNNNNEDGGPPVNPQEATTTRTTKTTATATAAPAATNQQLPWWYPRCCCCGGKPLLHGNKEALAYALDLMARSTVFSCSGAFLLPALLQLAKLEAGCEIEIPEGSATPPPCEGKVYGIRPSSLLTTILTIVGVVSAALLPLMGAIVDTTPYRRLMGRVISPILCALLVPTILVNEDNWFAVTIIFIILAFFSWMQAMVNYAYLPELTDDQQVLNELTRGISIFSYSFIVLFLGTIVAVSSGLQIMDDFVAVARISQSMVFSLLTICSILAYGCLYGPRPAAHKRPSSAKSIWTAGFIQLYATICKIHAHYPALQWYYVAIALSNSAMSTMLVIMMSYMTDQLLFSSQTIGTCVTVMLLFAIPGAMLSFCVTKCINPVNSSMASLVAMILVTTLVSILLTEPGQETEAYLLSAAWGTAMGWNFTCDRMVIASLVPKRQEAELMALFLFAGQCLNWLPPLIYTSMNEAHVSPRIGLAMLNVFFVLGIFGYVLMGSYDEALAAAAQSMVPPTSTRSSGACTSLSAGTTITAASTPKEEAASPYVVPKEEEDDQQKE